MCGASRTRLAPVEERADRLTGVDPADRLTQEWRDGKLGEVRELLLGRHRDRVREDQLTDRRLLDALDGIAREDRVGGGRVDRCRTVVVTDLGGRDERASGQYFIVDDEHCAALNLTDNRQRLHLF